MTYQGQSPSTRLLYYEDAHIKEFEADVLSVQGLDDQHRIILDQTAFYASGGGQPCDVGEIKSPTGHAPVIEAKIESKQVVHVAERIQGEIKQGDHVTGVIDWVRRHALMRNHTLAHLVAQTIREATTLPLEVVSSGLDTEKARLDLAYEASLSPSLSEIERLTNSIIDENRRVEIRIMKRNEAEEYVARFHESLKTLPPQVTDVRIVEINDYHACACGGTHVKTLGEIGRVEILRRMSKGKGVERIEFRAKTT